MARALKPLPDLPTPAQCVVELVTAHQNVGQEAEGRVVHPAPETNLLFVKSLVIVALGELDGVMVGMKSLQHHFARDLPAPGPSGNLRQQLKRSLRGAEVGKSQREVRTHHAYQSYAVHVVPFGDHL